MFFFLQFVNMVYCIGCFAYTEESLHPWDKSHLILVYDPFNVLLDSVCSILLRIFASMFSSDIGLYIYIYFVIFVWFWCQGDGGLIEQVWACSSPHNFLKEFEKDRC